MYSMSDSFDGRFVRPGAHPVLVFGTSGRAEAEAPTVEAERLPRRGRLLLVVASPPRGTALALAAALRCVSLVPSPGAAAFIVVLVGCWWWVT